MRLVEMRGVALQRSMAKSDRVQPEGFEARSAQCNAIAQTPREKTKPSYDGLWWRCGELNPGPNAHYRHFLHV